MPITTLPEPPNRGTNTAEQFSTNADTFLGALPQFVQEANALQTAVNASEAQAIAKAAETVSNAAAALDAKNAAEQAVVAATAVAGSTVWASGSYVTGAVVWSPINGQNYRRKSPGGASPTDPSLDPTNWYSLISLQGLAITRISGDTTAVAGRHYLITAPLTLTLSASPSVNDRIGFTDLSLTRTSIINPNGGKIRNVAEPMLLNLLYAEAVLAYSGTTEGWI